VNATSLSFSAVLLAGGKSTRMGRDKAGLIIDGQPLWQRQLATLRATEPDELFISGRLDGPYAGAGVPIVVDAVPGLGPLGGLVAALRCARQPYLLVLAVDLPAMSSAFLRQLVCAAAARGTGIVPRFGEWFEPLAAVYPRSSLPLMEAALRSDDRSLQPLIHAGIAGGFMTEHALNDEERLLFRNVNTPADL
jgi:molybdopterin-guanine dinucleotide biosynthesis protein A